MNFKTDKFEIIAADTKPGSEKTLDPKTIMKLCYLIQEYGTTMIPDSKNINHKKISVSLKKEPLTLFISEKFQLLNSEKHDLFFLENKMNVILNKKISNNDINSFLLEMEQKYNINLNEIFNVKRNRTISTSIPKPQKFNFANLLPGKRKRK